MTVICELLGVPRQDEHLFRQWGATMISTTISQEEQQTQMMQMGAYLLPLIEQERKQPRNTVLSTSYHKYFPCLTR
jgi:cytochrome P450